MSRLVALTGIASSNIGINPFVHAGPVVVPTDNFDGLRLTWMAKFDGVVSLL